ncbi:MAG: hypothetical protein ABIF10_02040 [Candidatus Woesearchaeota archaeon]
MSSEMFRQPKRFDVQLGYGCDNKCVFCCVGFRDKRKNKSAGEVLESIAKARLNGAKKCASQEASLFQGLILQS